MSGLDCIKISVRGIKGYTLERPAYEVKLDQNENPFDLPEELKAEVLEEARKRPWGRYPEFGNEALRRDLAEYAGWMPEGVLAGNGSNEMISALLAVSVEPGDRVLISEPTFTVYRLLGTVMGAEVISVPLRLDLTYDLPALKEALKRHRPKVFFLANPNNPTGCGIDPEDVEELLSCCPGLFVLDEAYYEFSGKTAQPLLLRYDNLIVLRTFSKAFGLAGLRVGYLLAQPDLASEIAKGLIPYNLNFFSQTAARKALSWWPLLKERVEYIKAQRDTLFRELKAIRGVRVRPSEANFLLFETPYNPKRVFRRLAERGVLVRDVSGYPMLSRALRVTVGRKEENERFLRALREVLEELRST